MNTDKINYLIVKKFEKYKYSDSIHNKKDKFISYVNAFFDAGLMSVREHWQWMCVAEENFR